MTGRHNHLVVRLAAIALAVCVVPQLSMERASFHAESYAQAPAGRGRQPASTAPTITYEGRQIPNTIEEIVNPKHTVLLVHEMLNDFITEGGAFDKRGRRIDASTIMSPIAKLLASARAKNVRVAYVRWTNQADNSTLSEPNVRAQWQRLSTPDDRRFLPSTVEHTWGWEIAEPVKPLPGDWVFNKHRPDAFFGTPLQAYLRWNGIKTLVVVGIGAEVGVVPTVLTASNLGYFTVAVSDALRPTDPARLDDAMKYINGPAIAKTHTELIDLWTKSPRFDPAPVTATANRQGTAAEPATLTYQGRQIPNSLDEILKPTHTALIVHEMLNDFISEGGGRPNGRIEANHILKPIANLLAAARAKKVRVAYVRWTRHADQSTNADPQIRSAGGRSSEKPYTIEGTWGWEAPDVIKPAPGEWIVRKYRTDAFFATPLDTLLKWNGIKTIVITGIGAEAGIVPTLMHSSNLGYFNVAVSDAMAPSNPTRMEDAMRFINGQAIVKSHSEIIDIWNKQ